MTIKLSRPKAYREILSLANSQGQPIRPRPLWDRRIVVPVIPDRPNCTVCRTQACKAERCDWRESDES